MEKLRVLLLDDEEVLQHAYAAELEEAGCTVDVFGDGDVTLQEGFSLSDYDVVVTDIRMPNLNGFAVVQKISELPKPIPCLLHGGTMKRDVESRFGSIETFQEQYPFVTLQVKPFSNVYEYLRIHKIAEE